MKTPLRQRREETSSPSGRAVKMEEGLVMPKPRGLRGSVGHSRSHAYLQSHSNMQKGLLPLATCQNHESLKPMLTTGLQHADFYSPR